MNAKRHTYLFYGGIVAVFLLSRVWVHEAGVRFNTSLLQWGWQVLDEEQLRHNLAESIWYLHAQPPLYNLLIGLVLKCSFGYEAYVFQYLYLTLGLAVALMLANTLRKLGVTAAAVFLLTLFFVCSPAALLYENWVFYTQLELFWMMAVTWAAVRVFTGGAKTKDLFLLFGCMACLCLTRSLYHWLLFVAVAAWVLIVAKEKKRVWLTAPVPFLLLMGWYLKTWVLFGSFSASTWFGMNFARLSYNPHTELGKINLWKSPATYDSLFHFGPSPYPAPVVSSPTKANGNWNLNHFGYIQVAKQFQKEAWAEFRRNPKTYRENVKQAFLIYFEPSAQHRFGFLEPNYSKLDALNRWYTLGYRYPTGQIGKDLVWITIAGYLSVFLGGLLLFFWPGTSTALRHTTGVLLVLVLFVSLAGNLFEIYENNRFRFPTIPLVLILAATQIQVLANYVRQKKANRKPVIR